jgi:hypothetical protein
MGVKFLTRRSRQPVEDREVRFGWRHAGSQCVTALTPLASLLAALPLPAPMLAPQPEPAPVESTPVELPDFPDLLESLVEAVDEPEQPAAIPKGGGRPKPQRAAPDPTDPNSFQPASMLPLPVPAPPPEPPVQIPDADWIVEEAPVPEPAPEAAAACTAEPAKPKIEAPESLAARVPAELHPVVPPEANAAPEPQVAQPEVQHASPERIEVRRTITKVARMTAPSLAPRLPEDHRPMEKPRTGMQHAAESLERRTAAPQPAAAGQDTEARDQGRNTPEPLPDRRVRPAATRNETELVFAAEPRGEVAFAARLIPIAPEVDNPPADHIVQVREKAPAAAPATPQTAQDAPKSLPVREIRLEVDRGERKVEVQLIERAGDVRVAVRTPDARLATDIRDNLPALSSRLEQTGYRTETWHGAQDGSRHPGQDEREHPQRQPQHQPWPEEPPKRKQKGQQFAWLMSSLQ